MNKERLNYVFRGTLVPVDNGYRNTGMAHLRHLNEQSLLERAVLIGAGDEASDDERATLAALSGIGVSTLFIGGAGAGDAEGWQRPWASLRARVSPRGRRRLAGIASRLAALPGPMVLFTIGWDPLLHVLPRHLVRPTLFLADSITLFEHNRGRALVGVKRVTARLRHGVARVVEQGVLRRGYPAVIYVSPVDSAYAAAIAGAGLNRLARVVPIGIDPEQLPAVVPPTVSDIAHRPTLAFSGVMAYGPNAAAARELVDEILPALADPRIEVLLLGRDSEHCNTRSGRVRALGWVESIPAELRQAHLFVAPVRYGAGAKNNVLAALAMGLPVIGYESIFSSFDELPPGCFPCADQAELVATVRSLLAEPEWLVAQRARIADAVRMHWSWDSATRRLTDIVEEVRVACVDG